MNNPRHDLSDLLSSSNYQRLTVFCAQSNTPMILAINAMIEVSLLQLKGGELELTVNRSPISNEEADPTTGS